MANVPLHEFIALNREELIRRCRAKVAARSMPPPTEAELMYGVPLFLDQLADALRNGPLARAHTGRSAVLHGHELLLQSFRVSQVVQDYGDVCQSVASLAAEMDALVAPDDFLTLSRCLDDAIAAAVTESGLGRNPSGRDRESAKESEHFGFLAHQARNLADTALLAFDVLKSGNVGVAGSTAAALQNTLFSIRGLMGRPLSDARLPSALMNRERFMVSRFFEELVPAALLEAGSKGITLAVMPVEHHVVIEADRHVLAAVVRNMLQNAYKFTLPRTTVTLRLTATAERALIEVEDECGGLPDGNVSNLFRPLEERSASQSMGLGLAFSRWGVEANNGRIHARNLPGKGCVFTVDLPRVPVRAVSVV